MHNSQASSKSFNRIQQVRDLRLVEPQMHELMQKRLGPAASRFLSDQAAGSLGCRGQHPLHLYITNDREMTAAEVVFLRRLHPLCKENDYVRLNRAGCFG
jgi:hypothetical protein